MDWVRQDTHGPAPLPGHGHTATLLGATHKKSKLVVFGGQGEDNDMLGETHILELGTWTWRHVQTNGPDTVKPPRRAFHTATAIEANRILLFGGATKRNDTEELYFNDTWLFVDEDRRWSEVEVAGTAPERRGAHTACLLESSGSRTVAIFGGTNGQKPFDDLWLLHIQSSSSSWQAKWEQVQLKGSFNKPQGRSYHCAAVVGDTMLVWGGVRPGKDEGCVVSAGDNVHLFSLARRTWSLELVDERLVSGPRSSCTAIAHGGKVLIVGGKLTTAKARRANGGRDRVEGCLLFDMAGRKWLPPPDVGADPRALRSGHSSTLVSSPSPRMLLLGGYLGNKQASGRPLGGGQRLAGRGRQGGA